MENRKGIPSCADNRGVSRQESSGIVDIQPYQLVGRLLGHVRKFESTKEEVLFHDARRTAAEILVFQFYRWFFCKEEIQIGGGKFELCC